MKRFCRIIGSAFLSIASLFVTAAPASLSSVAVEEIPESIKIKR